MSIGDTLAEARRQAGLTISQVSQQTRIRETIIRGIERGDFSACGGDFYARGHIRSIARTVGLDPDQLVREYDAAHGAPHAIRAAEVFEPSTPIRLKEQRSLNWSAVMILALVIIVGYGVYHLVSGSHKATPSAAQNPVVHVHHSASPQPPSTPPSSPSTTTTARELVIKIVVTNEPCWVGFTTLAGGYLTQATLPAGTAKTWTFKHAVDMTIGNPGAVELTVNGKHRLSPGAQANAITLPFRPVRQAVS
ncbi:MAG TPA: helix-turn-helix domain-containing protein [Streptosporangiaceae bacterium]|nr:helix-turn-helix domain-containing protein [Streptosporangiaceae bacterium]